MTREHPAGKGDAPRPVNLSVYGRNHDAIFRKTLEEVCKLCNDCDCMDEGSHHGTENFTQEKSYEYQ